MRNVKKNKNYWFALFSLFLFSSSSNANNEFPGRELYLSAPYIEINDLAEKFDNYQVVDLRSPYEFSILRIKGAKNIPFPSKSFIDDVKKLQKSDQRPIVVYCNDQNCMKPYQAIMECKQNKIKNIFAYDSSIMDWTHAFPEKTVLHDKTPVNINKLISKSDFNKRLLQPEKFELDIAEKEPLVLDIRDFNQREGLSLFIGIENPVNINDQYTIKKYIEQSNQQNTPLYIYDMAGNQVRWLQYLLERHNAKSYYFMDGGSSKYFKNMQQQYLHKKITRHLKTGQKIKGT